MKIGFIGLGRMGKNIVLHLLEGGIEVVAWNRSSEPREELRQEVKELKKGAENLTIIETTDELVKSLDAPRVVWLMVSAEAIDAVLEDLVPKLSKDDLVIDGGNSFYQETLRRAKELSEKGIHFMDVGTSGGVEGARHGACMMAGGSKEDFARVESILKAEAAPQAYGHLGPTGAGHFAKMVHNAIEYGMMESIGEGLAILKNSPFNYDFVKVLNIYNNKSVIDSRLVGWTLDAFKEDADLSNTSSVIGSGGGGKERIKAEGDWTVDIAKQWGIDIPAIENAMIVRTESAKVPEDSPNGFRNKVVAAIHGQFGHFDVKKS